MPRRRARHAPNSMPQYPFLLQEQTMLHMYSSLAAPRASTGLRAQYLASATHPAASGNDELLVSERVAALGRQLLRLQIHRIDARVGLVRDACMCAHRAL